MFHPNRRDAFKALGVSCRKCGIRETGSICAWDDGFDNFTTRTRRE